MQRPTVLALLISFLVHAGLFSIFAFLWERSVAPFPLSIVFVPEGSSAPNRGSGQWDHSTFSVTSDASPSHEKRTGEEPPKTEGGLNTPSERSERIDPGRSRTGTDVVPADRDRRATAYEGQSGRIEEKIAGKAIEEHAREFRFKTPPLLSPERLAGTERPGLAVPPRTTNDLMTVKDLASVGRYQAVILPDPEDKRRTTGYLSMTAVHFYGGITSSSLLEGLMRYMRDYTRIDTRIEGPFIELSEPALFRSPVIYMAGPSEETRTVLLSDVEREQLGKYLRGGGFLYVEDISLGILRQQDKLPREGADSLPFWTQMTAILREVLGRNATFFKLPQTHPIYHSFYDFGNGPPLTDPVRGQNNLYGIEIGGRLVAVLSNLGISAYWDQPDGERMLQFGVNVVVYALTQQGGIAVAWPHPIYGLTKERRSVLETEKVAVDSTMLPASVAFLRGKETSEEDSLWTVVFDGRVIGPPHDGAYDGLILVGVPPGRAYTVIIRYAGKERVLTITPSPGRVTTLWFAMEQIFSKKRIGVQQEKREEGYPAWKEQYKGKRIAEVMWEEHVAQE